MSRICLDGVGYFGFRNGLTRKTRDLAPISPTLGLNRIVLLAVGSLSAVVICPLVKSKGASASVLASAAGGPR